MTYRVLAQLARLAPLWLAALAIGCDEPRPATEDAGAVPASDASTDASEAGPRAAVHDVTFRLNAEIESVVYVGWEQDVSATSFVRYRFGDEEWQQTPAAERDAGRHEQIVLGIPFESSCELQVVATGETTEHVSEVVTGTTGAIPDGMVVPVLRGLDKTAIEPSGRYLFGSIVPSDGPWNPSGSFFSYVIDRNGRLVWARRTPNLHTTVYARVSASGRDFLIDDNTFWFNFDASQSRVQRVKIDGSVVQTYDTPGLHHPFTDLPDGTIAWGATRTNREETIEEVGPDGQRRTVWDSEAFLSTTSADPATSCFQSNALFWDELTDTYLFSSFCGFYIVQVARNDGTVARVFGGDLSMAYRESPLEARLFWQHGVAFTDDRTLLTAMHVFSGSGKEGVVREYLIDDLTRTLQQVWTWKDGLGTETVYAGEAHRLANGNTLVNYGTTPLIREVMPAGDIVWEIGWSEQAWVGRSVFVDDLYPFAP